MNELTTEQVFDILPTVVAIYEKTGMKAYREKLVRDNEHTQKKDVDAMGLGIGLFLHIIKNSKKAKEEIFEVIATLEGISIEEAKKLDPVKTVGIIKAIFTNEEATKLFKSAIQ